MRLIFAIILSFFLIWFGGYLWFLNELSLKKTNIDQKTDAIVVLTGRANRLNVAVDLLKNEFAEKLYISGVDEKVTRTELLDLLNISVDLAECCVESGNKATDTVGNAIETMSWSIKNDIKSIRVVTSLEHMPRAMVEFKRFMPNVTFVEHTVGSWRPDNLNYFNLSQEYSKYVISLLRSRASSQIYEDT
ncbi:MAG: YdcF family protein [Kordiimonadaceae bacterium]|jgi:uncharacterized SAM-binding protein YcdF (DUF218 family)|nr:YdcF family protein [Kordiimonadaceae bacterium]MBT6031137.1 YdcF family protein [Kordiimonadaceae bacterium]